MLFWKAIFWHVKNVRKKTISIKHIRMILLEIAEMSVLEKQQICKSKSCINRESTLRYMRVTLTVVQYLGSETKVPRFPLWAFVACSRLNFTSLTGHKYGTIWFPQRKTLPRSTANSMISNYLYTGSTTLLLTKLNTPFFQILDVKPKTDNSLKVELSWNLMAHGDAREGSEGETGEWSG